MTVGGGLGCPGERPSAHRARRRREGRAEDLALRRLDRRAGAPAVRGRRLRRGDAARHARRREGQGRRHARLPQELPDDDLRLVRDARRRRRGARLQDADRGPRRRRPRARDLGDGEPADREGPRRRHGSVLAEDARDPAVPRAEARPGDREGERRPRRAEDGRDPQGVALHQLRLLRLRVQLDGVRPRLPRARPRSRRASASSATRATARRSSGSSATARSTGSGTARGATSATSAARRASTRATRSRSSARRR